MMDEELYIAALRYNVSMRMKARKYIEEAQHHKDNGHNELHTDWIIAILKEIIE